VGIGEEQGEGFEGLGEVAIFGVDAGLAELPVDEAAGDVDGFVEGGGEAGGGGEAEDAEEGDEEEGGEVAEEGARGVGAGGHVA
jgi:hypothetical protein